MSNTIELLETIGKNASLRHAPVEHLAQTLAELDANENLRQAAASGDRDHLSRELGLMALESPQHVSQTAPEEEEEPNQDHEGNEGEGSSRDGNERDG